MANDTSNKPNAETRDAYLKRTRGLLTTPKIIAGLIGALFFYSSIGFYIFVIDADTILKVKVYTTIAFVIGLFLATPSIAAYSSYARRFREGRFIDVDHDTYMGPLEFRDTEYAMEAMREHVSLREPEKNKKEIELYDSFENYFNEIRIVFLKQIETADKKASILLDKGTAYARGGIYIFIGSIVAWQYLSWHTEFKEQYIYGIASCSILFIFFEFLAAWYLRQYRHFVDTSTYILKVKSIFDKFMLSYLTVKSFGDSNDDSDKRYTAMLKVLEEDIKWPESYIFKNADVSFTKEAMEALTHFSKAMRSEAK